MKMIVSDYDQTFYLNDEDIMKNKVNSKKFYKLVIIFFCFATGRNYLDFKVKLGKYDDIN